MPIQPQAQGMGAPQGMPQGPAAAPPPPTEGQPPPKDIQMIEMMSQEISNMERTDLEELAMGLLIEIQNMAAPPQGGQAPPGGMPPGGM